MIVYRVRSISSHVTCARRARSGDTFFQLPGEASKSFLFFFRVNGASRTSVIRAGAEAATPSRTTLSNYLAASQGLALKVFSTARLRMPYVHLIRGVDIAQIARYINSPSRRAPDPDFGLTRMDIRSISRKAKGQPRELHQR